MSRSVHILLLLAALASAAWAAPVQAQHLIDPRDEYRYDRQSMSLDEAVQRAERRYKARAVRAEVSGEDGRRVYVIRLMNDKGLVKTVRVDPETGNMF